MNSAEEDDDGRHRCNDSPLSCAPLGCVSPDIGGYIAAAFPVAPSQKTSEQVAEARFIFR